MNTYTNEALDRACVALRELAKKQGVECIEVHVRQDGRVRLYAQTDTITEWVVDADVLPGGPLQFPSAALCDLFAEKKPSAPDEHGEVECSDCSADIQYDATRAPDKQRCDHCEDQNGIGWAAGPKGSADHG